MQRGRRWVGGAEINGPGGGIAAGALAGIVGWEAAAGTASRGEGAEAGAGASHSSSAVSRRG